jgi:hypothetical protein
MDANQDLLVCMKSKSVEPDVPGASASWQGRSNMID